MFEKNMENLLFYFNVILVKLWANFKLRCDLKFASNMALIEN